MSIVLKSDFTGEYQVAKTCYDKLDTYIEKYEKYYLVRLLGAELYALFIADLTVTDPQTPQTARFISLFDAFSIDDCNRLIISEGIRKMLVQFIYFHYIRETQLTNTASGTMGNVTELGTPKPYNNNIIQAYNNGVDTGYAIQWFICDDSTIYPEENIQIIPYISGI